MWLATDYRTAAKLASTNPEQYLKNFTCAHILGTRSLSTAGVCHRRRDHDRWCGAFASRQISMRNGHHDRRPAILH
jgi:hypothetical protein